MVTAATATSATRIPVLLYHSVSDDPPPVIAPFAVSPATFGRHVALLVDGCHTVLSVSDLAAVLSDPARAIPPRPVVVTFDDGWAGLAEHAAPALATYGFPSTLYVTTALDASVKRKVAVPTGLAVMGRNAMLAGVPRVR